MDSKFDWITIDDPDEAERLIAEHNYKVKRNGEVCICGHTMKAHQASVRRPDEIVCQPARIQCLCAVPRPVLKAKDLRMFLKQTEGSSALHALGKGIIGSIKREADVEWIVERSCDDCGAGPEGVNPVPITVRNGKPATESTGVDKLLCRDCYVKRGHDGGSV